MPVAMSTALERRNMRVATWARRLRRWGVVVLFLVGLGACAWLLRAPLLRGAADLWIVSDEVTQADAVVVLGGQIDVRPFAAADLYRKGLVNKVLVSNNGKVGQLPSVLFRTHGGQSAGALEIGRAGECDRDVRPGEQSTRDEAVALREWADRHGASTIIIPTEVFAARRVRWMFEREFAGRGIRIQVPSYESGDYTRAEWWKSAEGLVTFQNEVIKYVYYRLQY